MLIMNNNFATPNEMLCEPLVFRKEAYETLTSSATLKQPKLEHFQQAVLYLCAKGEPVNVSGLTNACNIIVADFFSAPNIKEVDMSEYKGVVSDPIRIRVTDNFKVKAVTVEIYSNMGTLIEQDDAVIQPGNPYWIYMAKVSNPNIGGNKIIIKATDLPGNPITMVVSTPFE